MNKKFLFFIFKDELLAYDVERKEYISISDNTYSKYDGNTDIKNFCDCIANQFNEEGFADLAAIVTIINCGANLAFVDKLYNALEACKEKNVLNVERILPVIAFSKGIKKEQKLCFNLFGQYYLVESSTDNEICAMNIDKPQAETLELKAEDFALVYRFVADGQCVEELDVLRQQISDNEEAWKQKEGEWISKFDEQDKRLNQLEEENKVYKEKEQAELERQRKLEEERKKFKVGDVIKLGEWHNDPIEWQVLEVKDGKALLLSKYALAGKKYHNSVEDITWENCDLRKWLNGEFFQKAFKGDAAKCVVESHVPADYNPNYSTYPGNDTKDKVFLLSVKEVLQYFKTDAERICMPLPFVKNEGAVVKIFYWWLRSPGGQTNYAVSVYFNGSVKFDGDFVASVSGAVRPAFWVELSKL